MVANIFKALSDRTRLRIMTVLGRGEICACRIPAMVGKTQPAVSQHLKALRESGLATMRKDGTKRMYSLSEKGKRVLEDISGW